MLTDEQRADTEVSAVMYAQGLARGRMEGAKAMQESVILKLDECCEPCFQCNQNVTAMDAAAIVKGLNDADR